MVKIRRDYNDWVASETLEDYALRFQREFVEVIIEDQHRRGLMRLRVDSASGMVPEISGNRMLVSVRFQRADEQGRLLPCTDDLNFEMSLCT